MFFKPLTIRRSPIRNVSSECPQLDDDDLIPDESRNYSDQGFVKKDFEPAKFLMATQFGVCLEIFMWFLFLVL